MMLLNINLGKNCGAGNNDMNIFKDTSSFKVFMDMNMDNEEIGFDRNKADVVNIDKYIRYLFIKLIENHHKKINAMIVRLYNNRGK